jgi:pantoate--beta-alanine ligase
VLTIVKKFFDIIQPDNAYFGEKDYQQLAHIRKLVEVEKMPINIISCPTLRENDGLAMSSRNLRLTPDQRKTALVIHQVLQGIKDQVPQEDPPSLEIWGRSIFLQHPEIELEYLEIIDGHTFSPLADWADSEEPVALIAAYVGEVRLIDNMRLL